MGKAGSTTLEWSDGDAYFTLQTTSQKLAETLAASGVLWEFRDEDSGTFYYTLPVAWLRLRTKCGLLKLGTYPTRAQRGVLALYEDRPQLKLVK